MTPAGHHVLRVQLHGSPADDEARLRRNVRQARRQVLPGLPVSSDGDVERQHLARRLLPVDALERTRTGRRVEDACLEPMAADAQLSAVQRRPRPSRATHRLLQGARGSVTITT